MLQKWDKIFLPNLLVHVSVFAVSLQQGSVFFHLKWPVMQQYSNISIKSNKENALMLQSTDSLYEKQKRRAE